MPSAAVPAIAFFDVDETLISIKSMFDFYDFFLQAVGHSPEEQQRLHEQARALLRPGLPREQGNRLFYRRFADRKASEVADIGRRWFDQHLERGDLIHWDVLDALRAHRADGLMTVLVSGSFPVCLNPLTEYCQADMALSTELEVREGIYTGEVSRTMIGAAKAEAARRLIDRTGISAADCYAYGDHTSDLDLLRLVGHPVMVGDNPELAAVADQNGWHRLAGATK
jgi:HAD superfamily hydrolase (TIGR01490 family)